MGGFPDEGVRRGVVWFVKVTNCYLETLRFEQRVVTLAAVIKNVRDFNRK